MAWQSGKDAEGGARLSENRDEEDGGRESLHLESLEVLTCALWTSSLVETSILPPSP